MAFDQIAADLCGVAGAVAGGHTQARFVRHHVVGVMASDCEAIGLEVVDPFAATTASRTFVDINGELIGCGPGC